MPAGEDRREDLLDDVVLPHNHLVQFLDHQLAMSPELVEELIEVAFVSHGPVPK
jgi:hypothetical protein